MTRDEDGNWLLLRDLDSLSLGELYRTGDYFLPATETDRLPRATPWDEAYVEALERLRDCSGEFWSNPLRMLYDSGDTGEPTP